MLEVIYTCIFAIKFPDEEYREIMVFADPCTLTHFLGFLVIAIEPPYGAAITKLSELVSFRKESG